MEFKGNKNGNGYTGTIEYVGKDYFIIRSYRTDKPVLILPYLYDHLENQLNNL